MAVLGIIFTVPRIMPGITPGNTGSTGDYLGILPTK